MSSGGRTLGVTTGAASGGSTPQTSIPVTTSAPTPSIPAAKGYSRKRVHRERVARGSIKRGSIWRGSIGTDHTSDRQPRSRCSRRSSPIVDRDCRPQPVPLVELELDEYGYLVPGGRFFEGSGLDIATRLAAKYGPLSVWHKNAKARVESRREKNIMKKKFGVYPEPKHSAFLRLHGMKRVFEFMRTGRDFPEVGGLSIAEVGADDTAGADDGADGAAAGSDVGADDDGAEFSELEGSGGESEEDDEGQAPQQEPVEELEDAEDDKKDEPASARGTEEQRGKKSKK
ncbi:hypothetical protein R1sor_004008 [Riccia sorocarpa]|uniref:Uncharacterized protein n=1 Tax=Riccia sorocarpa TaxID=122646 RepID=A0ABD3H550_9MARC